MMASQKYVRRGYPVLRLLFTVLICLTLWSIPESKAVGAGPELSITAEPWPAANRHFERDPHWLGGDGASSVKLDNGRILWLFGDSFINPGSSRHRADATVIRNSVAIQRGADPTRASLSFHWRRGTEKPESFFKQEGDTWFWPGSGLRIQDRLFIFLMKIVRSTNRLGFDVAGWTAVLIDNPDSNPERWRHHRVTTPKDTFGVVIGSGSVFRQENFLYAVGADALHHDVYLVRWPIPSAMKGHLSDPQWWTGKKWRAQSLLDASPPPVFTGGAMEFSVHYEPRLRGYLQIQARTFIDQGLFFRRSARLTGPWSKPRSLYRPITDPQNILIYAGKAHPELKGADLACTYALNSMDYKRLLADRTIYYPRFLKVFIRREVTAQGSHP